jgi:murein DD-endopeptidase MepM/ murein hydrolase activator NlpD
VRRGAPVRLAAACIVLLAFLPLRAVAQGQVHVVAPGDTLTALALRYDTTVEALRERNGLQGDLLRVGQELVVPGDGGWRLRTLPLGESWADLARSTGLPEALLREANPGVVAPGGRMVRVPPDLGRLATPRAGEDLVAFAARLGVAPGALVARNGLEPPYRIEPNVPLLMPPDRLSAGDPPAAGATHGSGGADASATDAAVLDLRGHDVLRDAAFVTLAEVLVGVRLTPPDDGFGWPLDGAPRITSRFGWRALSVAGNRYHLGLDLGAPTGTPVRAVRPGEVVRTGWIGAYGYAVYLRHADGYETRYAHLSRIDVQVGERVDRGQTVGRVGSTGASTGPHLHLEVRLDGRALDPLLFLPGASTSR